MSKTLLIGYPVMVAFPVRYFYIHTIPRVRDYASVGSHGSYMFPQLAFWGFF